MHGKSSIAATVKLLDLALRPGMGAS